MRNDSLITFIAGAAIGATLGILFAPEKGEVTRRKIKEAAQDGYELVCDGTNAADEVSDRPGFQALKEYPFVFLRKSCFSEEIEQCIIHIFSEVNTTDHNSYEIKNGRTHVILNLDNIMYVEKL